MVAHVTVEDVEQLPTSKILVSASFGIFPRGQRCLIPSFRTVRQRRLHHGLDHRACRSGL